MLKNDHFNVKVTHITKTISLGQSDNISQSSDRTYWEGHGVMTYPKFIPVTISFTKDEQAFGGFSYDRSDSNTFNEQKISLPCLRVWLSDRNEQKATFLSVALRDAIISGQKYADIRFFKKKDEGLMTPADKEHGYSYQSRYMIWG